MAKQFKVVESPTPAQLEQALNKLVGDWSIEAFNVRDTGDGTKFMAIVSKPKREGPE